MKKNKAEENSKNQLIYGTVKVSDKGQIAIPVELRKKLDIQKGDQLLIGKMNDDRGIILLKMDELEEIIAPIFNS